MKTNKLTIFVLVVAVVLCLSAGKKRTTIFVIGDSTAAEKSHPESNPERGWGMMLQGFFDDDIRVDVTIQFRPYFP
jgi:pectinesterase